MLRYQVDKIIVTYIYILLLPVSTFTGCQWMRNLKKLTVSFRSKKKRERESSISINAGKLILKNIFPASAFMCLLCEMDNNYIIWIVWCLLLQILRKDGNEWGKHVCLEITVSRLDLDRGKYSAIHSFNTGIPELCSLAFYRTGDSFQISRWKST